MQHVFIDVEAMGPPGMGRPFALGAAKFDLERGVFDRWSGLIKPCGEADADTMAWLSSQTPDVLAQLRGRSSFWNVWDSFLAWVYGNILALPSERPTTFYADDWADFAWIDFECRTAKRPPLRTFGPQYDTSLIIALVPADRRPRRNPDWIQHVAVDDAAAGALEFIHALKFLGRGLPC